MSRRRGGPGRPPKEAPKFTPAVAAQIVKVLRAGNTYKTAAATAGIQQNTLRAWLEQGERATDPDDPKLRLLQDVKKALADAVVENVALIHKAAREGTWTAAAWWLERRHSDEWGKPPERTVLETEPITVVIQFPDGTLRPLRRGAPPPALPPSA